jgi:hypothetical protein
VSGHLDPVVAFRAALLHDVQHHAAVADAEVAQFVA